MTEDEIIEGTLAAMLLSNTDVPEICQQFGCRSEVQTWCPLCRAFLCDDHDQLYPLRRHDCLRGPAEVL